MACKFFEMIEARWATGARVCVGLDPDMKQIPLHYLDSKAYSSPQFAFNEKIIKATAKLALCYKVNLGFYKGPEGLQALRNTVSAVRNYTEGVPIILDAKYGDIGNTNLGYVETSFDWLKCDAVTVHNYMGQEAMKPFLDQGDKGIFVLCRTSNEGADEFQNIVVEGEEGFMPLYEFVARRVSKYWNGNGNCGLVIGATATDELYDIRKTVGIDLPFLMPGFGKQEATVALAVKHAVNGKGRGIICSNSSSIIFADDPKQAALAFADEINAALPKVS